MLIKDNRKLTELKEIWVIRLKWFSKKPMMTIMGKKHIENYPKETIQFKGFAYKFPMWEMANTNKREFRLSGFLAWYSERTRWGGGKSTF